MECRVAEYHRWQDAEAPVLSAPRIRVRIWHDGLHPDKRYQAGLHSPHPSDMKA
jgi:hypothetical protein